MMKTRNVIFDFDSTIITGESLEMMLEDLLDMNSEEGKRKMSEIVQWTNKGMNGECSFAVGLEARLAIAAPRKQDLIKFQENNTKNILGGSENSLITRGMPELFRKLIDMGVNVYIMSGGFTDLIVPFG